MNMEIVPDPQPNRSGREPDLVILVVGRQELEQVSGGEETEQGVFQGYAFQGR